jgi:GTP cyclohydrolase II
MFKIDVVHSIISATSLEEAKETAIHAIKNCGVRLKQENKDKGVAMVKKCKCQKSLAFGMTNFMLAFENLRVIK